jgi:hypothetical protein
VFPVLKNHGRRSESVFTVGFRFLQKNLACLCGDFPLDEFDEFDEAICCLRGDQGEFRLAEIRA